MLVLAAGAALRDQRADACIGEVYTIDELTTFDPSVLDSTTWDGLYYDPFNHGFGGPCADCAEKAMLADWRGYLKDAVTAADWQQVLLKASEAELAAIAGALAGKGSPPKGYERSSLWKSAARDRLAAAVALVQLARRVEPYAAFQLFDANGNVRQVKPPYAALLSEALAGVKAAAKEPFLAQRYAFQAMRIQFYKRDWTGAISFFDRNAKVLAGPSADLSWRARYYLAGALGKDQQRARGNLELARVHANYPPLSGAAVQDFQPMEEADWRATLKFARDAQERAMLWRLVGVKQDGIVAVREIVKLDPKSNLIPLLLVRELARAESGGATRTASPYPASPRQINLKAFATVEQLAAAQAATPGADRPWLMELVAAHAGAMRGDVAQTRARVQRAMSARPGDAHVAAQAKASLVLALAKEGTLNPATEQELAKTMGEIDPSFKRLAPMRSEVRNTLALAFAQAGKLVEAEFLRPGIAYDPAVKRPAKPAWEDPSFIKEMIAQTGRTSTPFERFLLADSFKRPALEHELALRYLVNGDFANAAQTFKTTKATSAKLGTDPFVIHIVDCHDCDHVTYESAPWTHASFAARLAELDRIAKGNDENAADASLAIGNALYNITSYGNARVVLSESHFVTSDTSDAEKWYKRAYDLSKNRERKAKAAFLASKAELDRLLEAIGSPSSFGYQPIGKLPIPRTWFPVLKKLSDTKYYREVLRECGHFADWAAGRP